MSTLGFGVLGLLARESMTGYEISRRMQVPVGYMWTASHTQIYGELATLERDGLVRHRVVAGPGPRDTKRYSITARGQRELESWVDSPLSPRPARSELMLRVRCFWMISPERCRYFLESVRLDHEQRLSVYLEEERDFAEQGLDVDDPGSQAFSNFATLNAGIRAERAIVEWCEWLSDRLSPPMRPAGKPTRRERDG